MVQSSSSSTSCSRNPAIVLVTGGFHSPSYYQRALTILENSKFETHCLALLSLNCDTPQIVTGAKDAASIRSESLQPSIEDEEEVLLVMYLHGGGPGSAAAKGLSVVERRQQGLEGGVIGQVFVAVMVAEGEETALGALGGEWPDVMTKNDVKGIVTVQNALEILYADVLPLAATEAVDALLPYSMTALTTPFGPPSWSDSAYNARRVYNRCTDDKALPLARQDTFWEKTGVNWITRDIKAAVIFQESYGLDSKIADQPAEVSKTEQKDYWKCIAT